MSALIGAAQAIYWLAKIYFMLFGILYIAALLGKFDMNSFAHITGVIGILFLFSNIIWYSGRGR